MEPCQQGLLMKIEVFHVQWKFRADMKLMKVGTAVSIDMKLSIFVHWASEIKVGTTLQGLAYEFTILRMYKRGSLSWLIEISDVIAILGAGQRCTNKLFANL